jgi:hypothetical protein
MWRGYKAEHSNDRLPYEGTAGLNGNVWSTNTHLRSGIQGHGDCRPLDKALCALTSFFSPFYTILRLFLPRLLASHGYTSQAFYRVL